MVALSQAYQSKALFHLVGSRVGIPAGDLARVYEAVLNLPDTITVTYVQSLIDACDVRYAEALDGSAAIAVQLEEYAGDLNRTISRSQRNQQTIDLLYRAYWRACEHLARVLWCPIYSTPDSDYMRFARSGGEYVKSLPGTDGMAGFHLMYLWETTTTAPPTNKYIRANNASLSSTTALYVAETDRKNKDVSSILNYIGAGSVLQLTIPSSEDYVTYLVTGVADSGTYRSISVTWLQGTATAITADTKVNLSFLTTVTGATGDLLSENAQTGASYTLLLSDQSKTVSMNNAGANTLTIPTNASVAYPIGTLIYVYQLGAGQTTIAASGGVTLRSAGSATKLRTQYSWASLFKRATDEWVLSGDITV